MNLKSTLLFASGYCICVAAYYRAYQHEIRIFLVKRNVKSGKMTIIKVCSIVYVAFFPPQGQFVKRTSIQIFPFCCEPFTEPFFHIFVRTEVLFSKLVTHRRKRMVLGRG